MGMVEQLAEIPLFHGVDSVDQEALKRLMYRRAFARGEVVFRRGDPGDSMYIVLSGRARVYTEDEQGNEFTIRYLDKMFGEWSVLDGEPRSASVAADQDLDVLVLHRADFIAFVRERPLVGLSMMRDLAGRVRYTTTYLQQVLDATNQLAQGDYDLEPPGQDVNRSSDLGEIQQLIGQFIQMVRGVHERQQKLTKGKGSESGKTDKY